MLWAEPSPTTAAKAPRTTRTMFVEQIWREPSQEHGNGPRKRQTKDPSQKPRKSIEKHPRSKGYALQDA